MTNESANKATLNEFFQLLGTPDIEGLKSFMAEDLQWILPQNPRFSPRAGTFDKNGWEQLYRGFIEKMPAGVEYEVIGVTAEGDRVAVEAESRADTPLGPFNNRYHFLFQMCESKIIVAKEYADSLFMHMFAQSASA